MAEMKPNWDLVPEPMRESVSRYVDLLVQLDGDNIRAITLYGAIAGKGFDRSRQTVQNVRVLESVNLWKLYHLADHGLSLGKARIASPLVMTPQYIQDSLDTFPLELIEIHQRHVTLMGDDYFSDLTFKDVHVRLQCERELKTLLIRMRQGLLAAAGRKKLLGEMEDDLIAILTRTLRGMLWLKGLKNALPAIEVLTETEKSISQKLDQVRDVLEHPGERGWDQFRHLYADIEALGAIVDVW